MKDPVTSTRPNLLILSILAVHKVSAPLPAPTLKEELVLGIPKAVLPVLKNVTVDPE